MDIEPKTTRQPAGELAFVLTADLQPQQWAHGGAAPVLWGSAAATHAFRPARIIGWVETDLTFGAAGRPDANVSRELLESRNLGPIVLVGMAIDGVDRLTCENRPVGEDGRPPIAEGRGLSLSIFGSGALGGGVSFPACERDAAVAFEVCHGFLGLLGGFAPDGYDKTPTSIKLAIHFRLIGPALR